MKPQIGITEGGDAALDLNWLPWVHEGNLTILISKNPLKLIDVLQKEVQPNLYKNIIVHCTITGFGGSDIEPNVPNYAAHIESYKTIKDTFKQNPLAKLVLRVDPIVPTEPYLQQQLDVISLLGKKEYFDELKVSFLDYYPHIGNKLPTYWRGIHAPLELRQEIFEEIKTLTTLKISICGEPGMTCTGCVSTSDLIAFNKNFKDFSTNTSQKRKGCTCIAAKKELLKNTHPCEHSCTYCYWKPWQQKEDS